MKRFYRYKAKDGCAAALKENNKVMQCEIGFSVLIMNIENFV